MSAPRCLRVAVESCRPIKQSLLSSYTTTAAPIQYRTFSITSQRHKDDGQGNRSTKKRTRADLDVFAGFPEVKINEDISESLSVEAALQSTQKESTGEVGKTSGKTNDNAASTISTSSSRSEFSTTSAPTPAKASTTKTAAAPQSKTTTNNTKSITTSPETSTSRPQASSSAPISAAVQGLSGVARAQQVEEQKYDTIPPNVRASYLQTLKHKAPYGVPVASLQLRSYSLRSLEFYADFCLRAAYYLKLPASGPAPLPKKIERWTVIRSNFAHKKSQENFERVTYRRVVTIFDGDKSAVEAWLAYVRKNQFYGVGMKANVWDYESLDVAAQLDKTHDALKPELEAKLSLYGTHKTAADRGRTTSNVLKLLENQGPRQVAVPMTQMRPGVAAASYKNLEVARVGADGKAKVKSGKKA